MKDKKFLDFAPVKKQTWINQSEKDLKGENFGQRMVTQAIEGFPIFPFYTSEDLEGLGWIKNYENRVNPLPQIAQISPRNWINAVVVDGLDEIDLNREIHEVLDQGANGLILDLSGNEDLNLVFRDVLLSYIHIWIRPKENAKTSLKAFYNWVSATGLPFEQINGGLLWVGLAKAFDHPIDKDKILDEILFLHHLSEPFPNFKSCCLDISVYHNAGAHAVQELGYGLSAMVDLLDVFTERGADPSAVFSDIFIYTAVGSSYFMEIAKIKTLRIAFRQLASLYQVDLKPEEISIFTCSSSWNKSKQEANHNILRNTTEAMSAIIGGCNTLHIIPHDSYLKIPDQFSKRMARNISNILKEEAYFDKVLDPSAGSYLMENLIHSLSAHAFELLKMVEEDGGWWQQYLDNKIQRNIREVRSKRIRKVVNGEIKLVGINPGEDKNQQISNPTFRLTEEDFHLKSWNQFIQ